MEIVPSYDAQIQQEHFLYKDVHLVCAWGGGGRGPYSSIPGYLALFFLFLVSQGV